MNLLVVYSSFLDENAVLSPICKETATWLPWHHAFMTLQIFRAFYQVLLWKQVLVAFLTKKSDYLVTMETSVLGNYFFELCSMCYSIMHHNLFSFCLLIYHLSIIKIMFLPFQLKTGT